MSAQIPKPPPTGPHVRIGELSRRTGVRTDTLRAWERRYGLLAPLRTQGGFRLYGPEDERRVRAMVALTGQGVAAAEAARLARADSRTPFAPPAGPGSGGEVGDLSTELQGALESFDEPRANRAFDRAVAALSTESLTEDVVLPVMRRIGERWHEGKVGVAEEHFATNVVRGRLLGLGRNWGAGTGPLALLACPPGELHDLGLVCFGLLLRERGWRVAFLGPDSPIASVTMAARSLGARAVVLAALDPGLFLDVSAELKDYRDGPPLYLAGPGAGDRTAPLGLPMLPEDPAAAAAELAGAAS